MVRSRRPTPVGAAHLATGRRSPFASGGRGPSPRCAASGLGPETSIRAKCLATVSRRLAARTSASRLWAGYGDPSRQDAGVLLERCESGRIGLTANELTWETGSEGSNPSLSAQCACETDTSTGRTHQSGPSWANSDRPVRTAHRTALHPHCPPHCPPSALPSGLPLAPGTRIRPSRRSSGGRMGRRGGRRSSE
jgi:hypothetical protein